MNKIKKIVLQILQLQVVWALLVTALLIIFIPPFVYKFNLSLVKKEIHFDTHKIYFEDIDNDGYSEKIELDKAHEIPRISIFSHTGELKKEISVNGVFSKANGLQLNDFDNDGNKELFFLYNRADTVFIGAYNITAQSESTKAVCLSCSFFVTKISPNRDNPNYEYGTAPLKFADLNQDGYNEFIFYISANYSYSPRQIFAYDIMNNSLIKSPIVGANITPPEINFNQNDELKIAVGSYATDNFEPNYHHSNTPDTATWLFFLDKNL